MSGFWESLDRSIAQDVTTDEVETPACGICHKPFEDGSKVVEVTRFGTDDREAVHLWHLAALPTVGGGVR